MLRSVIPDHGIKDFIVSIIEASPNSIALLDDDRRLIYANDSLTRNFSVGELEHILHLRPGDIFHCVNATEGPDGCGSARECEFCGAMQAMRKSQREKISVTRDYRINGQLNGRTTPFNFKLTSTPIETNGQFFYLITLQDISSEVRKTELEQIFFHDMMNAIGGLHGVIQLMKERDDADPVYLSILEASYNTLYDTINEQKQYTMAETGTLTVKNTMIDSRDMIIETVLPFRENRSYRARVEIDENSADHALFTDPALLSRILTNMLKNALEASGEKDTVTIGASKKKEVVRFWVHNPAMIPHDRQMQLFERSFTTKGKGRGIGTFSMKLLGENYLGGKVDFQSDKQNGTTFWIDLPLNSEAS